MHQAQRLGALGFGLAFGLTRNSAPLAVAGAPRAQLYYCLFHPSGKVPAHVSSSAVFFQLLQRDSVLAGGQVAAEGSPQILLSVTPALLQWWHGGSAESLGQGDGHSLTAKR